MGDGSWGCGFPRSSPPAALARLPQHTVTRPNGGWDGESQARSCVAGGNGERRGSWGGECGGFSQDSACARPATDARRTLAHPSRRNEDLSPHKPLPRDAYSRFLAIVQTGHDQNVPRRCDPASGLSRGEQQAVNSPDDPDGRRRCPAGMRAARGGVMSRKVPIESEQSVLTVTERRGGRQRVWPCLCAGGMPFGVELLLSGSCVFLSCFPFDTQRNGV